MNEIRYTLTIKQFKELQYLGDNQASLIRLRDRPSPSDDEARETLKKNIHLAIEILDDLKVPFWVQNVVLFLAWDWQKYFYGIKDMKEYLLTKEIAVESEHPTCRDRVAVVERT